MKTNAMSKDEFIVYLFRDDGEPVKMRDEAAAAFTHFFNHPILQENVKPTVGGGQFLTRISREIAQDFKKRGRVERYVDGWVLRIGSASPGR